MNADERKLEVAKLIKAFNAGSLLRNPEYQRGEAWSEVQKATFIDSIFRAYPIPALFLHVVESAGLEEEPSKKYEIVDGQQRLTALRDYAAGKFTLLEIGDKSKLRIPKSIRAQSKPWAGKFFGDLSDKLVEQFESAEITVFQIGPDAHPDEIRDLFIRLQSGTALSRQQIRDAWPGNLGPFVERLAGKLDKHPTHRLFAIVDKRGQRSEDEEQRDYHVGDRQTCAQLLKIFLARERDPHSYPSVSANELDAMYHEYTDFDANGKLADRFKAVLSTAAGIFERVKIQLGKKAKFRRLDVTVVMMYIQDITKSEAVKFDKNFIEELAQRIVDSENIPEKPSGKSTAGSTLERYYLWWRENVCKDVAIRLDGKRTFDPAQKRDIRKKCGGKCGVCGEEVAEADAEYDHHPIPHRDGGKTDVENGRLVHRACHPRGRPLVEV
ncbi:MAG: HNH endonuclease family protein [Tepidisphaeraceae bacterium]